MTTKFADCPAGNNMMNSQDTCRDAGSGADNASRDGCRRRLGLAGSAFFTAWVIALGFSWVEQVDAQEIYKTINENGVVEYTTIPPDGSKPSQTLETLAEPTEAEIQAAQAELRRLRESLEEKARERAGEGAEEPVEPDAGSDGGGGGNARDASLPSPNPLPALTPFL